MGSAEGRRKCCFAFFRRGYDDGMEQRRDVWGNTVRHDGDPWEPRELCYFAGTVSRSFRGLYRYGYEHGTRDRIAGTVRNPKDAYEQYKLERDTRKRKPAPTTGNEVEE